MNSTERRAKNVERAGRFLDNWRKTLDGAIQGRLLSAFQSELATLLGQVELEERDRSIEAVRSTISLLGIDMGMIVKRLHQIKSPAVEESHLFGLFGRVQDVLRRDIIRQIRELPGRKPDDPR